MVLRCLNRNQNWKGKNPARKGLPVIQSIEVYEVATFYTQFRFTPVGKRHIMVCKGTACHVKGAPQIIEGIERHLGINEGEITFDMDLKSKIREIPDWPKAGVNFKAFF